VFMRLISSNPALLNPEPYAFKQAVSEAFFTC
jgi:hypothetical protein